MYYILYKAQQAFTYTRHELSRLFNSFRSGTWCCSKLRM